MVSVVVLAATSTLTAALTRAATAALIMGGSGLGDPTMINDAGLHIPMPNYIPNVENYYIAPNSTCQPGTCRLVPVVTPEGLLPPIIGTITFNPSVAKGVSDLNIALRNQLTNHPGEQVVIFGYSQSGDIITKTLRNYAADPATAPPTKQVSFVVAGNTNRPNGGILSRFPGLYVPVLNVTEDGPAPTDTGYQTTDIAFQYDPVADFPEYPIDVLADLNAVVAFLDVHATYPNPYLPLPSGIPFFPTGLPDGYTPDQLVAAENNPNNRQTYGDTTYITIPAKNLPLVQPLLDIGNDTHTAFFLKPAVDLIQPTLRVLVELGYDRTIPYGQPTPAGLLPKIDPAALAANLSAAVGQGVHDALSDVGVTTRSSSAVNPALASRKTNSMAATPPKTASAAVTNTAPLVHTEAAQADSSPATRLVGDEKTSSNVASAPSKSAAPPAPHRKRRGPAHTADDSGLAKGQSTTR